MLTSPSNRRSFLRSWLKAIAVAPVLGSVAACGGLRASGGRIMTVKGPVAPAELGRTLSHEHVLVDFIGAGEVSPDRYDASEVFRVVLPHLERIRELGCRAFFDFTPAFLGRDPLLLLRFSEATGLHIVTNTGFYGARNDRFLPDFARDAEADELASFWVREYEEGIEGTGIRPGFLKIGVDPGPLSPIHAKLIRAAARTHQITGLTIAVHTGPAGPAFQQLAILNEEGVDPSAWIWVHAQGESDTSRHAEAAGQGAWVALDGLSPDTAGRHLDLLRFMKSEQLLHRVLLSHDAGWYSVGEENGGEFRGYDFLFSVFVDRLREAGFTEEELHRLTVSNPAEAFTIAKRLRSSG